MKARTWMAAPAFLTLCLLSCRPAAPVRIGSKEFTESEILSEMALRLGRSANARMEHIRALGGTRVLWDSLVKGEIDLYPEYTGTLADEIFAGKVQADKMAEALAAYGIGMSSSLGFDDSYALGMKQSQAQRLGITTISDLVRYPDLRFGFSNEFMDRRDGWAGLRRVYGLPQSNVNGLEHQLAYRALDTGAIDVTDVYTTDAEILHYRLLVLHDDRQFFPIYTAVFLYRDDLARRAPGVLQAVLRLQGAISRSEMIGLNARVKLERALPEQEASGFVSRHFNLAGHVETQSIAERVLVRARQHLFLVSVSLAGAILISIPLGVLAYLHERAGQVILGVVGAIQTIPSLALIVFMIPLLGIGDVPAIAALFLYSLLPIVRSTHSGLKDIPVPTRESAEALGLPRLACIRLVELPMASRAILSGIKTSAVINVGTATLGALIGAGGFGQPIFTGIRLNDMGLILEGAVPAAALALLVQGLFDALEPLFVSKGLRINSGDSGR